MSSFLKCGTVNVMEAGAKTIRAVIGENVRRIRGEQQITAEELARDLKFYGLKWNTTRISELESGNKAVGVAELVLLAGALGQGEYSSPVTVMDLLQGTYNVALSDNVTVSAERLQRSLAGESLELNVMDTSRGREIVRGIVPGARAQIAEFQRFSSGAKVGDIHDATESGGLAEKNAARALGVSYYELLGAAWSLWGHSLTEERARRSVDGMSKQARGHITRELLQDLRVHIDGYGHGDD